MRLAANLLAAFVALEHLGFLVLEMFLFTTPTGLAVFKVTQSFAEQAAVMMMNQGLYNGFLAAGLAWSLLTRDVALRTKLQLFFFACVLVAGLFGAATVSPTILYLQAVPGGLGLVAAVLARPGRSLAAASAPSA